MFTGNALALIFQKTEGHCHFCGDPLILKKYGCKNINDLNGAWEADHVIQRAKGGKKEADNCLPACVYCNRLRWNRKGDNLREVLLLGLIAKDQMKKSSPIGKTLTGLMMKRLTSNERRRRKPLSVQN
ncbi:MAG: HNH endonuclease signature motif containing protein [Candidatus Peribacteraceae bacterium]|nr:HNH endonuclease signature motif containing protein [Candidatus Peribacteraceae bacterium]MDD5739877.1 HNH endonuclease signature motif containing protein [Candidatus Peribacteraceae bacterium]